MMRHVWSHSYFQEDWRMSKCISWLPLARTWWVETQAQTVGQKDTVLLDNQFVISFFFDTNGYKWQKETFVSFVSFESFVVPRDLTGALPSPEWNFSDSAVLLRCPAPRGHYHGHGWNYHRGEVPGWEQTGLSVFEAGTGEGGYGWIMIPYDSSWLPGAGFFVVRLGTTVLRSESLAQDLPATLHLITSCYSRPWGIRLFCEGASSQLATWECWSLSSCWICRSSQQRRLGCATLQLRPPQGRIRLCPWSLSMGSNWRCIQCIQ